MKKVFKIILTVLIIILFPLGMLYCIGKALFADKRNFVTYLGMFFIFILGFCLCVALFYKDLPWAMTVINWFQSWIAH